MLSALFVTAGTQALTRPDAFTGQARPVAERVVPIMRKTSSWLPTQTRDLVRLNGAVQLAGGLMLATSHLSRPAAMVLAGSLVPTTVAGHPFWRETDPARRRAGQIQVLKNMGIFGGLLLATLDTEGRPDLRWRARHLAKAGRRYRRMAPIASVAIIGRKIPKLARGR